MRGFAQRQLANPARSPPGLLGAATGRDRAGDAGEAGAPCWLCSQPGAGEVAGTAHGQGHPACPVRPPSPAPFTGSARTGCGENQVLLSWDWSQGPRCVPASLLCSLLPGEQRSAKPTPRQGVGRVAPPIPLQLDLIPGCRLDLPNQPGCWARRGRGAARKAHRHKLSVSLCAGREGCHQGGARADQEQLLRAKPDFPGTAFPAPAEGNS